MGVESMIFSTILDAGARSLAYGQATTRALEDIIKKYDMGLKVAAEAAAILKLFPVEIVEWLHIFEVRHVIKNK